MKKTLQIFATFDQPDFLQQLVERLAQNRTEHSIYGLNMPAGWAALNTSSNETYVSGTVILDFSNEENIQPERINMPFITSFAFTCLKDKEGDYELNWSCSLN